MHLEVNVDRLRIENELQRKVAPEPAMSETEKLRKQSGRRSRKL